MVPACLTKLHNLTAEERKKEHLRNNVCVCERGGECQHVKCELQLAQRVFYLLLATGSAISNLARNWKYCSSLCCVKPVPTSSV